MSETSVIERLPSRLRRLDLASLRDYGVVIAFVALFITLSLCSRLDRMWKMVRRAAGHEQRDGALPRIFGASAVIALVAFGVWFLVIEGPAPSMSA